MTGTHALDGAIRDLAELLATLAAKSKATSASASTVAEPARKADTSPVIVRSNNAGVHWGVIVERSKSGRRVVIADARRVFYWAGAASLSELAVKGTAQPDKCKIPTAVGRIELTDVIEILTMTPEAVESLLAVPVWSAQ